LWESLFNVKPEILYILDLQSSRKMNTQVKQPQTIADFEVGFTCFDNFLKYISKRLQGAQKGRGSEN